MPLSPQPILQRMDAGAIVETPVLPVVGFLLNVTSIIEGGTFRGSVQRTSKFDTACSVRWAAEAPVGNLNGLTTGVLEFAPNILEVGFTVTTVNLNGAQGNRNMTLTLSDAQGCKIDQGTGMAMVVITDQVDIPLPDWFKLPVVSGRAWASGVADIGIQTDLAYVEAATGKNTDFAYGPSAGNSLELVLTWDAVIGGPIGQAGIDNIPSNSQLDWLNHTSRFSLHLDAPKGALYPDGSRWLVWGGFFFPSSLATNTGNSAVWDEIIAGTHAAKHQKMGERIAALFARKGQPLKRLIIVPFPEMNKSGYYQVFMETRFKYKAAIERIMADVRAGAGFNIRFAHMPAQEPSIGDLASWAPVGIDALGMSFLPDARIDTVDKMTAYIQGTLYSSMYGVATDLLGAATQLGVPVIFPTWGPRFEWGSSTAEKIACPRANDAIVDFVDNVLSPVQNRLVGDGVRRKDAWDAAAYKGTQSGGVTEWQKGVQSLKDRFAALPVGDWQLEYSAPNDPNQWLAWGGKVAAGAGVTVATPATDGLRMYGGTDFSSSAHRLAAWLKHKLPLDVGIAIEITYKRVDNTPANVPNPGSASQLYVGDGVGTFNADIISTTGGVTDAPDFATVNANIKGGRTPFNTAYSTNPDQNSQIRYRPLPIPPETTELLGPNNFPFTAGRAYRIRWEMVESITTVTVRDTVTNLVETWSFNQVPAGQVCGLYFQPQRDVRVSGLEIYVKPGSKRVKSGNGNGGGVDPDFPVREFNVAKRVLLAANLSELKDILNRSSGLFPASAFMTPVSDRGAPLRGGDHLYLNAGIYSGVIEVPSHVRGVADDPVVLMRDPSLAMGAAVLNGRLLTSSQHTAVSGLKFIGDGQKWTVNNVPNNRLTQSWFDGSYTSALLGNPGPAGSGTVLTNTCIDRCEFSGIDGVIINFQVNENSKFTSMKFYKLHIHDHTKHAPDEAISSLKTAGFNASEHRYKTILFQRVMNQSSANPVSQKELISAKVGSVTFEDLTFEDCGDSRFVLRNANNCTIDGVWMNGNGLFIFVYGKGHTIRNVKHSNPASKIMELSRGDAYAGETDPRCRTDPKAARATVIYTGGSNPCVGAHCAAENTLVEDCSGKIEVGQGFSGDNVKVRGIVLRNNGPVQAVRDNNGIVTGGVTETGVGNNNTTVVKLTPSDVGYNAS